MPKLPKLCPSCTARLEVTRLTCLRCGTEVTGHFEPDFFARLAPNDFDFVVLFIQSKGNIKEMERILGISYWTIRSKLNDIVEGLSSTTIAESPSTQAEPSDPGAVEPGSPASRLAGDPLELTALRQQILEQLNSGLISVDEAAVKLEELKRRGKPL